MMDTSQGGSTAILLAQSLIALLAPMLTHAVKLYLPSVPKDWLPGASALIGVLLMMTAGEVGELLGVGINVTAAQALLAGLISGGAGVGVREQVNRKITRVGLEPK